MSSPEKTSSSHLDARNLIVRAFDEKADGGKFHITKFPITGLVPTEAFKLLWGILDTYIQRLEPVNGFDTSKGIAPLKLHSPQYQEIRGKIYTLIAQTPDFDIKKLQTVQLDKNGILHLNYKGNTSHTFNITESWNNILLPKPLPTAIVQATRDKQVKLQEQMNRESYLGGSVIVEYMPAAAIATTSTIALGQGLLTIKSLIVRTDDGKMRYVKLNEIYTGTKEILAQNLMKIMQGAGYIFDAGKKIFFDPMVRVMMEGIDTIRTMTYEQFKKIPGNEKITELDFVKYKEDIVVKWKPTFDAIRTGTIPVKNAIWQLAGAVSKNAMHLFFLPVFFQKFSKYQNSVTFLHGAAEMSLFMGWVKSLGVVSSVANSWATAFANGTKIGWKIANIVEKVPMPKVLRPILWTVIPLAAGGLSVVWGGWVGQKYLDLTRAKWRHFNGAGVGSQYSDGYSALGHATGFGITDALHQVNKFARWANDEDEWDLGIPRIEIPLWKWKYLGTTPEITWFQDKINLGTDPWEWVRWAAWRDTDTWNKYVDLYKPRLKTAIYDILGKYTRNESMFSDADDIKKAGSKEKLLETHLIAILESGSTGTGFNAEKRQLLESIIAETINIAQAKWPTKLLGEIIDMSVDRMKVDTFFIETRSKWLELRKTNIASMVEQFPANVDPKSKAYINTILARMITNQPLFAPNVSRALYAPGSRVKIRDAVLSEEENMFNTVLNSDDVCIIEGKTMKIWEYFAVILDTMLDWKRESEFLAELKKWNKKWVQWTL
jgi:hypothetical protein